MLSVTVHVFYSELPSVTVERFRESLCKDLKAASELTEELSDLDVKSFLDSIISTCSEGQIFTSGVGEYNVGILQVSQITAASCEVSWLFNHLSCTACSAGETLH